MTLAMTTANETILCPLTKKRQGESSANWQPFLSGSLLQLRPLKATDFDELFAAASDPLIWEMHPDRERYRRERFELYFQSGLDSGGALAVIAQESGKIIGSSRFTGHHLPSSSIEIGYTFLTRDNWGSQANNELKRLMLNHAFQFVDRVYFVVGRGNFRSQRALAKIGARLVDDISTTPIVADRHESLVYFIDKALRTP